MTDFPLVMTAAGPQPTPPAVILAKLIATVSASNQGYTANLPGSLIEDISSTDVAAIAQIDTERVDTLNSLTPLGANEFLLIQLGDIYGVSLGRATNTSVLVQFTGTPGFVIAQGFTVSDTVNQFIIPDGGIIAEDGLSAMLLAVATQPGAFAVAAGTVQEIITSVPSTITLSVNNPQAGTPAQAEQTPESYRSDVLQAGLAASQGMSRYLKTLLRNVAGVQQRLVSVVQLPNSAGWEIIVGGGDPYEIANAIFMALFDIVDIKGSTISVTNITKAANAVVTTDINHGKSNGDPVVIIGVTGMTQINGVPATVTNVLSEKQIAISVNSTGFDSYVSGGELTPNDRNVDVSISDFPDTYTITYVNPPQQTVDIALLWNTTSTNIVSDSAMSQLGGPALVDYVNSVYVGQPMNLYELQSVFRDAVSSILPPSLLTRMQFTVTINGVATPPEIGTGIIAGDPESYFQTEITRISIAKG